MQPEQLTLSFTDADGRPRQIVVRAARFRIGRSPDNDLHIPDSNLSRQHALIEISGARAQISDCGSSNGTRVNTTPVEGFVTLRDGDQITLGNSCTLRVSLRPAAAQTAYASGADAEAGMTTMHSPQANRAAAATSQTAASRSSLPSWLTPPVLAALVSGLVVVFAALLLYALTRGRAAQVGGGVDAGDQTVNAARRDESEATTRSRPASSRAAATEGAEAAESAASGKEQDAGGVAGQNSSAVNSTPGAGEATGAASAGDASGSADDADSVEQTGREIRRVMSRISTDSSPYVSEAGVRDVAARLKAYRGSAALQERLRAMQRGCADVSAQAQGINLKPSLVMYAALAQAENGGGDPATVARQMMPKLLTLRATFGTATANSTLLLVAAYPYPFNPAIGSQARTPHPLYSKLVETGGHRSTVETSVARSVWFLREKSSIMPEAYDLVVRTLAIGIIAQNPRRYGINADPLLC